MQGEDSVLAYFPSGTWYSLTGHPTVDASDKGETLELHVPLGKVAVHVLGGSIIPMQVKFSCYLSCPARFRPSAEASLSYVWHSWLSCACFMQAWHLREQVSCTA